MRQDRPIGPVRSSWAQLTFASMRLSETIWAQVTTHANDEDPIIIAQSSRKKDRIRLLLTEVGYRCSIARRIDANFVRQHDNLTLTVLSCDGGSDFATAW
jgi:hypothetical protein